MRFVVLDDNIKIVRKIDKILFRN